ncbi:MAG TPA: alcohol dehydrogenase catalytic domain-containing protein [Acetobacteraceae bacterium]|nr:alcohol dehydrogenase catalytic domain-containing protein [Acetobacteraceae bacterium]
MRALVLRDPGCIEAALRCETIPEPSPGPRQLVIRVAFCGVCSHDVAVCTGLLRHGIKLPCVPGHEIAGTVSAIGKLVGDFSIGDRVATTQREHVCGHCRYCRSGREPLCAEQVFLGDTRLNGGYAEFVVVDADNVVPVPDDVALDAAAIASCAIGTMLHAVRAVGRIAPGDRVMVTGAGGGLGIHGVQLAKRAGGWVIAQTTSAAKAEALKGYGADAVVVTPRDGDFSADVRAATNGEGVDCVLDTVGTPVFTPTRRSLARGGRWVLIGQLNGEFVPFNPAQLFLKEISMLSATSTTREELRLCLDMLRTGGVCAVLGACFSLAQAAEALTLVQSGTVTGRVILSVGG